VTRLADMGVEPFLLSSVLNGVLAQRLVRRLCPACAQPHELPPELCSRLGLDPQDVAGFRRAQGCPACKGSGYAGRIAVLEFLPVDDEIARLILLRADTREIAAASAGAGHASLLDDCLAKARAGIIGLEDAVRVASGQ
jgi:general secretion pathway protein E